MRWTRPALLAFLALTQGADAYAQGPTLVATTLDEVSALGDRAVALLDLSLPLTVDQGVALIFEDARRERWTECAFGMVHGVARIEPEPPTTHLLLEILPGDPRRMPHQAVACEIPRLGLSHYTDTVDGVPVDPTPPPQTALTVRGCFLVHEFAVPTARQLSLRPSPMAACAHRPGHRP